MLRRTAFRVQIDGEQGHDAVDLAKLAFDAVDEAFKKGGESNRGSIVCQFLKSSNGGIIVQGQFLPAEYAARVAAVFTEFSTALRVQEAANPTPAEEQMSLSREGGRE